MRTDRFGGALYTLQHIAAETSLQDGTYVAQIAAEYDAELHYWRPALRLTAARETAGYEIAYAAVSPEEYGPTEGGARVYLREGDRLGVWTSPEGTTHVDRTAYLQGGDASLAWLIGETYAQRAIWEWHTGRAIGPDGGAL